MPEQKMKDQLALYEVTQDLFEQMYASLADHSSRRLVNRLMNIDVLLIDE